MILLEPGSEFDIAQTLNIQPTAEVHHLNGLLKANEGDILGSFEDLQKAFEESQNYQIAMDWGRIAWENGNNQDALIAYGHAAQTTLGQTLMWPELNRGRILHLALKDYDAAIEAYNKAIDIFFDNNDVSTNQLAPPEYIEAFFRLGQAYEAKGDRNTAIANYDAALALDANYEPALAARRRLGQ